MKVLIDPLKLFFDLQAHALATLAALQINKCKKSKEDAKKPRYENGHQKKREAKNIFLLKPPQRSQSRCYPDFGCAELILYI